MTSKKLFLNLVEPEKAPWTSPVQVVYRLLQNTLFVDFQVSVPVLFKKDIYEANDFPYMYDVVEVFIATNDPSTQKITYFEYEITPLNQTYNLKLDWVSGTRVPTPLPPIKASAEVEKTGWRASFEIPLAPLENSDNLKHLRGNFFAILGNQPRTYWSAFLPPQDRADFHKPEFFKPL